MSKDKLFLVTMAFHSYATAYVQAATRGEALDIALELDGADFEPDGDPYGGDSEIVSVEEAEPVAPGSAVRPIFTREDARL